MKLSSHPLRMTANAGSRISGFGKALALALMVLTVSAASQALTLLPLDDTQLVERSERILQGRVAATEGVEVGAARRLMTRITLEVSDRLKGDGENRVTFLVPGGTRDGIVHLVAGVTPFHEGQEAILFLRSNKTTLEMELTGSIQGRFDLLRDAEGRLVLAARDLTGAGFYQPGQPSPMDVQPLNFEEARDRTERWKKTPGSESLGLGDGTEFYDYDRFVARIRGLIGERP